jgi:CRP-like cAMP-binding protein
VELQAGEILFQQDEPGDGMYWIESGLLVVLEGRLDEARLLTFRHPGQVVGEIALLENVQRTASVAAIAPTRLRYLSKEKFQGLVGAYSRLRRGNHALAQLTPARGQSRLTSAPACMTT